MSVKVLTLIVLLSSIGFFESAIAAPMACSARALHTNHQLIIEDIDASFGSVIVATYSLNNGASQEIAFKHMPTIKPIYVLTSEFVGVVLSQVPNVDGVYNGRLFLGGVIEDIDPNSDQGLFLMCERIK